MNSTALWFMLITEFIITALTLYFFIKVLFMKPKVDPNEDSYLNNDPVSEEKN
jgi:hypothetical protein